MNKLVIADPGKCIGCRTCEVACVLAHETPGGLAKLAPAHFIPRLKVVKTARVSTPVQCRQCEDAPCAKVCPTGTLVQSRDSIQVVQTKCIGCKSCVMACVYGAIEVVPRDVMFSEAIPAGSSQVEAFKCDLCAHRLQGPSCIEVCPTNAIYTIDALVLAERTRKRREQAATLPL
jgi:electron transport protein HydN